MDIEGESIEFLEKQIDGNFSELCAKYVIEDVVWDDFNIETCDTPEKLIDDIYSDGLIPFRDLCRKTLSDLANTVGMGGFSSVAANTVGGGGDSAPLSCHVDTNVGTCP